MGYAEEDGLVRGDLFKPSGKWGYSIQIDMRKHYNCPDMFEAIAKSLSAHPHWGERWARMVALEGWRLVVLEPYHPHSHPACLTSKHRVVVECLPDTMKCGGCLVQIDRDWAVMHGGLCSVCLFIEHSMTGD